MNIMAKIYKPSTIKRIQTKTDYLQKDHLNPATFLLTRLLISLIISLILIIFFKYGVIYAFIFILLMHYLSEYIVFDVNIYLRNRILLKDSITFFEMLKLSLSNDDNLETALKRVILNLDNSITKLCSKIINTKDCSYKDSITSLIIYLPSQYLKNQFQNLLITSNYLGTTNNIITYLHDYNRKLITKSVYQEPVKIIIISLLFIIPIILLLFNLNTLSLILK